MSHHLSMGFHTSTLGIPCIRPLETEYTGMGPIYPDRLLYSMLYICCTSMCCTVYKDDTNQYFQITQISICRHTHFIWG